MSATNIIHIPIDKFGQATGGSTQASPQLRSWYRQDYTQVIRPTSSNIIENILGQINALMNNHKLTFSHDKSHIGLWEKASQNNWDLIELNGVCCCNDIELISTLLKCANVNLTRPLTRDNIYQELQATNLFTKIQDKKVLESSIYLHPADILLTDEHIMLVVINNNLVSKTVPKIGNLEILEQTVILAEPRANGKFKKIARQHEFYTIVEQINKDWLKIQLSPSEFGYIKNNKYISCSGEVELTFTKFTAIPKRKFLTVYQDSEGRNPLKTICPNAALTIIQESPTCGKLKDSQGWVRLFDIIKI